VQNAKTSQHFFASEKGVESQKKAFPVEQVPTARKRPKVQKQLTLHFTSPPSKAKFSSQPNAEIV